MEHLALIEKIIGPFPRRMINFASNTDVVQESFGSNGTHRMGGVLSRKSLAFVRRVPRLESMIRQPDDAWFLRLLRNLLVIDPEYRACAKECLFHFGE